MKLSIAILYLSAALVGWTLAAQDAAQTYKPTETQQMRLKIKQQDAIIAKQQMEAAQRALQDAQKAFQDKVKALSDEGEAVRKEQKWPETVKFDFDNLTFAEPPKEQKKP